jgi:hypothetical protein
MLCTPPHCTKDVYIQQGSTRDLWTVHTLPFSINFIVVKGGSNYPVCIYHTLKHKLLRLEDEVREHVSELLHSSPDCFENSPLHALH